MGRSRTPRRLVWLGSAAVLALQASAAAAQEQTALEEVIVTAQRQTESLQNVPLAVSAFDSKALEKAGFTDVEDLSSQVPNLQISALWGSSSPKIFLRGIGNNSFNQTAESKVAVYLDQVYLSAPSGQLFQMFDLERVEVLRGPQGTLYGKNSTGGAISVTSKAPGDSFAGFAKVGYGNYGAVEAETGVTIPLGDTLSVRVAGTHASRDGYVKDLGTGRKVNDENRSAGRVVVRFEPGEGQEWLLNVHGGRSRSTHNNSVHRGLLDPAALALGNVVRLSQDGVVAGGGVDLLGYRDPNPDPYVNTYGTPTFADIDLIGASLIGNVEVGGGYRLTTVTGYEQSKRHVLQEGNGAPSTVFTIDWGPSKFTQFSQEIRLASPTDQRFHWIAGVFYYNEKGVVNNFYNLSSLNFALGFDAFDQYYTQKTHGLAGFGQAYFDITDKLTLTVGGRLSKEDRKLDHVTYIGGANRSHIMALVDVDLDDSWIEWSGRAALDFKPTDDVLLFASINRGFQSGGFNTGAFNDPVGAARIFDPEVLVSYEVGAKTMWFDRRLRLNVTGFYYDYQDLQVFTFTPSGQQFINNASAAKVYGAEIELQALPTPNLEIAASAGLLHSEYKDFLRGGADLSGNKLIGSPDRQFNVVGTYRIPLEFGEIAIRGDFTYAGNRYYDDTQARDISSQGSDVNLDASISFSNADGSIDLTLWAKNLTDEVTIIDVVDVGLFGYQNVWYNMPRTWGVSLRYNF